MREHLIQCLERGYFTKFPQNYNCTLKHKMIKIQCCCPCGFPDWVVILKQEGNVVMYGSIQSVEMLRLIVMKIVNKN